MSMETWFCIGLGVLAVGGAAIVIVAAVRMKRHDPNDLMP